MNLNHFVLSGNLTRDPEIRSVGPDKTVANFTIAHNIRYKSAEGEAREETTFVDCEAWGRQGELAAQYLTKGSLVIVEGALRSDHWTDKEGQKRSRLKLRVERVHFTPRGRADSDSEKVSSAGEAGGEGAYGESAPARGMTASHSSRPAAAPRSSSRASSTAEAPPF